MALSEYVAIAGGTDAMRAWWVPGRIEVLGKHTDYAGGRSLLCAAEHGFAVAALPRADQRIAVIDARSGERVEGELTRTLTTVAGHWANYPFTVARRVALNFPGPLHGVTLAFASDLPPAAGLSSSSALVVGTFLALVDANDLATHVEYKTAIRNVEDLGGYLGAVENGLSFRSLAGDRGVGTSGGSQDQTAILCGRPGTLVQYRFAPVRYERSAPFPADRVLVVAASGVRAEKTGGAMAHYNRVAERAAVALELWRGAGSQASTLAAALDEAPDAFDRMRAVFRQCDDARFTPESLIDRVTQLYDESMMIIPEATDAIARGDVGRFGDLVDRSQRNAERFLDNQIPETITLARTARELGAAAASAFGAGFGGSVYALVRRDDAESFRARWAQRYTAQFPAHAATSRFILTGAGPGATKL